MEPEEGQFYCLKSVGDVATPTICGARDVQTLLLRLKIWENKISCQKNTYDILQQSMPNANWLNYTRESHEN